MTYYKATRCDGRSFHDGGANGVQYRPGATARPLPIDAATPFPQICGPGVLHASDVEAETLVGGSWPCRLFEVEGEPVVGFNADHPHKGGFVELRVVREIEAWRALGPNGRECAALITWLGSDEAKKADWAAAESAAESAAEWSARWAARSAASAAWLAAWSAAASAASAWLAAWAAAASAARALVTRDLITAEQFATLYAPMEKVLPYARLQALAAEYVDISVREPLAAEVAS